MKKTILRAFLYSLATFPLVGLMTYISGETVADAALASSIMWPVIFACLAVDEHHNKGT